MHKSSKIFVAGHKGLVGSSIVNELVRKGYTNIITKDRSDLDLTHTASVAKFFESEQPDYVFLAAAKVGGILANHTQRADFLYENLMIQNNVIHQSYKSGVKKLLFLGSTCIYPKEAPQPLKEEYLLTDILEYTNEPYAIAKIAGIKLCESYNLQYDTNFLSVMPTNLYGPNDNFDFEKSHVLPALIRKIHLASLLQIKDEEAVLLDLELDSIQTAKATLANVGVFEDRVEIWGSGRPLREFLWSEDLADACVFIMENVNFRDVSNPEDKEIRNTHLNIGTGQDISIRELAEKVKQIVGFKGELFFNTDKPDGTYRKLTDSNKIRALGWAPETTLDDGIQRLYNWYLQQSKSTNLS